ncbi:MAG: hypothetical protein U1A23_04655 [Candidatus Sungbacteria bacterium]|nr:hypothetical protein [bacterium]MDZ4286196.1 hypothetical protein [Candidatus Sungbacteria bacterium]
MEHTTQREAKTLLVINGIFGFAIALGGIFLQVFLFGLGGFYAVVEYNLVSACALVLFSIISGLLLTKMSARDLLLIGIGSHALLFISLFLFRGQSLDFLILLGFINGAAMGIFWAAMNLLQYIFTTSETRHTFFGRQSFLFSITGGVAPIIGGAIISLVGSFASKDIGYSVVFFLIALLMVVLYYTAATLPDHGMIHFSMRDVLAHRRSALWFYVLAMDFCNGLFDFMFASFSAVIIFLIVKDEFLLGSINAAGAVVAACAGLAAGMILKRKKLAFIPASFIAALGILIFALEQNWWGLGAMVFLFSAAMPILGIESSKALFDVLDRSGDGWKKKYHLFLERENALGLGRVSSLLICFFLITGQNELQVARSALAIIACIPVAVGLIRYRILHITREER